LLVDSLLGELGQKLVGLLFLLQRLVQELSGVLPAEVRSPTAEASVTRDLIVLYGLRRSEEGGVERVAVSELGGKFTRLANYALNCKTGLRPDRSAQSFKYPLEARELNVRFI
jgi:hypothetical protein